MKSRVFGKGFAIDQIFDPWQIVKFSFSVFFKWHFQKSALYGCLNIN